MSEEFPERFGRYTILQRVAFGGMAEILLAIEEIPQSGKRFVTIKRIRRELQADPDYIDFFLNEGFISMRCSHPNIPQAFDLDTVGDVHYLAMEYIRGHTLLDVIKTCYAKCHQVSVASALRIIIDVAAALEHLHTMQDESGKPMRVIHRDVTPQNIMIDALGEIKLIDLGIARSDVQPHTTQVGVVKGKVSYLSPEQLVITTLEKTPARPDLRSDIFSLGIVLYETLTTRALFSGKDDNHTMERIRKMPIPKLSSMRQDVEHSIDAFLHKALERKPSSRFQTAASLILAIEDLENVTIATSAELRDEVLALCGDPPIPTLSGPSLLVLKDSLQNS